MGDVVNLNQFRKKRDRASAARQGATHRARSGRTKAERQVTQAEAARTESAMDGKRIEHTPDVPESGGRRHPEED